MPQLTELDTLAQGIKAQDELLHNGNWVPVIEVKKGTKNIAVTYRPNGQEGGSKTTHRPLLDEVRVRRMQATAEEQAAAEAEFLQGQAAQAISLILNWAEIDVVAASADLLAKYGQQVGNALGWYGAEMVALDVKREYGTYMARAMTREENPMVGEEALLWFAVAVEREAMRIAKEGSSRSTSQWRNVVEDSKREALFKLLDDWQIRSGIHAARKLGFTTDAEERF